MAYEAKNSLYTFTLSCPQVCIMITQDLWSNVFKTQEYCKEKV